VNALLQKYPQEVETILAKYPPEQKRAATMPLLYLAQREHGYVTRQSLHDIGEIVGISATDVASLVGFYTLYHDQPCGKFVIEVCNDLPCALRGAEQFLQDLCDNLGLKLGETSTDGLITIEAVTCLAGCDHAPLFQVQTGEGLAYHEDQTVESALALIEGWRARESAQPQKTGAQIFEEPVLPVAEEGTTRLTRDERIRIMQTGAQ
jgi:NADH-quinone oxidoreductase subunit E